jgi:hypothetical protein
MKPEPDPNPQKSGPTHLYTKLLMGLLQHRADFTVRVISTASLEVNENSGPRKKQLGGLIWATQITVKQIFQGSVPKEKFDKTIH